MFKLLWKSQSDDEKTRIIQEDSDRAFEQTGNAAAIAKNREEALEEIRKMRSVILRMRRTKLLKVLEVVFEGEEIKYLE